MPERRKAFTELFDAHFPAVLQYLQRRCRTAEDAEDIAADVFRIAWEKQGPRHPFSRAWLLKVASNALTDYYRRRARFSDVETALARGVEEPGADADLTDRMAVREVLLTLPPREQEALRLTYWDGLSGAEVAEVLGVSPGAVWTLLARARSKLSLALSEHVSEGRSS